MIAVIDLIPLILFFLLKLIIILTKKNITIPIKNIIQNSNIEIGNKEEILAQIDALHPVFSEIIPLTLEEVFISEMEVAGYDLNNILP